MVTAAFARSEERQAAQREDAELFCSLLDEASYGQFDRELFIATLDDWAWFGEGQPPAWYTGRPWNE